MCAIAALIQSSGNRDVLAFIDKMTEIVSHRGPDGFGHQMFGDVAFGHRRLAIVDLSHNGHQPMSYKNRFISYNGEIYNHPELREELAAEGYTFQSHTDTEVILAAHHRWGEECLQKFNGMWAFAIFDQTHRELFVARDRFGVKPLYFWRSPEGPLAFASEIKQFTVLPGWKAKLNYRAVLDFLAHGVSDHTSETMFEGVYQVPAGHSMTLSVDDLPENISDGLKRWYHLPHQKFKGTYEEAKETFRKLFFDSVKLRLRADVGVGSCLSGGLDSSSIVCVANQMLRESDAADFQETFSACWDQKAIDESRFVDIVANQTNVHSHRIYPTPQELFEKLDKIIWHQDEPFLSTSIFAQWKIFEAAKDHVKVMLDGQGADEELLGYPSYHSVLLSSRLKRLDIPTLLNEMRSLRNESGLSYSRQIQLTMNDLLPRSWAQGLKSITRSATPIESYFAMKLPENPLFANGGRKNLYNVSRSQILHTNLPMLLHWEDRNSMAHGIEARVPFLDYRLVEFALSLPDEFKLSRGVTKKVMRDALASHVPQEILNRRDKIGFGTPEKDWFQGEWREKILAGCRQTVEKFPNIFERNILHTVEAQLQPNAPYSSMPWRMYCFSRWAEIFGVH